MYTAINQYIYKKFIASILRYICPVYTKLK